MSTLKLKDPFVDNEIFTAEDHCDEVYFAGVIPKHHVGPHPAGEVIFDEAFIDHKTRTITYRGPRTDLSLDGPLAAGCNEHTSYTYQLNISVGAQIATE